MRSSPPADTPPTLPTTRALVPVPERPLVAQSTQALANSRELAVTVIAAFPAVGRALAVAATALVVERVVRGAIGPALGRVLQPQQRAGATTIRTEVTEWVMVERVRRRPPTRG